MARAGVAGRNGSCNGGAALLQLATVAPALATTSHDPSKPDLFGQAYRRLFDAAFHAIIEGRTVVATTLFPIIIDVADKARLRLTSDLSDERMREQAIFGTEPFVDMMELSGYALLMAHVDPPGIQPSCGQHGMRYLPRPPCLTWPVRYSEYLCSRRTTSQSQAAGSAGRDGRSNGSAVARPRHRQRFWSVATPAPANSRRSGRGGWVCCRIG